MCEVLFKIKNKMKNKLLWIWISSILIISVAGFVFFNIKSLEVNLGNEKNESYHETVKDGVEKNNSSDNECYDKDWNNLEMIEKKINCFNKNWEKEGIWIRYNETKLWKFKIKENYKNWKRNWKYTQYYEDWTIMLLENYKDWNLDWKSISYDEYWEKIIEMTYVDWILDWEQIDYHDGDWFLKTIYKNWEIVDIQENPKIGEKVDEYLENYDLMIWWLWNRFESWLILDVEEYKELTDSIYSNYNTYYTIEFTGDFLDYMYKQEYENKSRKLIALYSMMNCSEDPSNPETYLFNLDDPKLAQEIYFKNCPKWCMYSDEEDVDFVCE